MRRPCIHLAVAPLAIGSAAAQTLDWRPLAPRALDACRMAYDVARDRYVVLSGLTYEWNGRSLQQRPTDHFPDLVSPTLAYDLVRQRTVAFGFGATGLWEYDGNDWTPRSRPNGPSPRARPALAFDLARGLMVMFGGSGWSDTWTWDGTNWQEVVTPGPSASTLAMAFHLPTLNMVLFTGANAGAAADQTWTFDGASWTQVQTSTIPRAVSNPSMATNVLAGSVQMIGEDDGTIWSWNGLDWTSSVGLPYAHDGAGFAADLNGNALVVGGMHVVTPPVFPVRVARPRAEVWQWDGVLARQLDEGGPPPPLSMQLAYDSLRDRVVGYSTMPESISQTSTWEWDREHWHELPTLLLPQTLGVRMCFDPVRGVTVRYGGIVFTGFLPSFPSELHELTSTGWVHHSPTGPAGRWFPAMAFDPVRNVVLVFGGNNLQGNLNDTWTWDGTNWAQVASGGPPARYHHCMAFDPLRGRAVLFGGIAYPNALRDTWEWDGQSWQAMSPATVPMGRNDATIAYDPAQQRCVMLGGTDPTTGLLRQEMCTWNGIDWTIAPQPLPRAGSNIDGEAMVLLRPGEWLRTSGKSAWIGTATNAGNPGHAGSARVGAGCGATPPPTLGWFGDPVLGQHFELELLGGAVGPYLLGFGLGSTSVPIGADCVVHLPALDLAQLGLTGSGRAVVAFELPNDPLLLGATVTGQLAQFEPGAPLGLRLTNGVRLRLGR